MKVLITAPKYDPSTSAHLITVDLEKRHTKHMHDDGYSIDFMLQPILPNVPYLSDEHMTVLKALAAKAYDHLVVIGKPGILAVLESLLPEKITVICPPMSAFSYDDYVGKEILEKHNGTAYALNKQTLDWIGRGKLFKLDMSDYGMSWRERIEGMPKGKFVGPLVVDNQVPASLTRMIGMGMKGVKLVTSPKLLAQSKDVIPIDPERGLTPVEAITDHMDAFVCDRSMNISDVIGRLQQNTYPVIGAQHDESVFNEIAAIFGTRPMKVFDITEEIPAEADAMLEEFAVAYKKYKEADMLTTDDILLEIMK